MRCSLITPQEIIDNGDKIQPGVPIVLLLRAGVLVPEAAAKFGSYHEVFASFLQNGLNYEKLVKDGQDGLVLKPDEHLILNNPSNPEPQVMPPKLQLVSFNVIQKDDLGPVEYPSHQLLKDSLGLLISGSASNAYDDIKWIDDLVDFSRRLIDDYEHLKLFGICFGHQIFARALGSQVIRNELGWEFGIFEVELSLLGQALFDGRDRQPNLTLPSPSLLRLHQVHRDIVASLPANTHNLGTTAKCGIHGFVKMEPSFDLDRSLSSIAGESEDGLNSHVRLLCLQGHPEFTYDILRDSLNARTKNGTDWSVVDQDSYRFAIDSLARFPHPLDHHGFFISSKVLKILHIL
ncbi:hypothetical protein PGT21_006514 [Puccinia graminis f. sp. tritici]|uniref:Glutamine amidotransferase domain-containing protein n=1 Tax=Puccinia graminis f. sp. tritici TaxID=56615 RepID=A0A5B0RBZ8_PUCGR|nr:hypothetical protein PGT21_006514 [Puccinia graminis f. sp. tritici]KAA1122879.1 hypothetical protein PGTUg99_007873 [Puccinia graminis f. sp. tritici]